MVTNTQITIGGVALLAIVAIVLNSGLIGQESVYACLDTELAMVCDSLSAVNVEGFQTRCYFNDGIKDTYKVCNSGWLPYTPKKPSVNFTDLDHVYLLCEKNNELVSLCQIIDQNETLFKVN